jgi:hypothetical protein
MIKHTRVILIKMKSMLNLFEKIRKFQNLE